MTEHSPADEPTPAPPPIRRPVLFYGCVVVAFGLLGAAAIRLALL